MTFSRDAPAAGGEITRPFRQALGLPYRLPFAGVKRRFGCRRAPAGQAETAGSSEGCLNCLASASPWRW